MARKRGWTALLAFLLGAVGASIFWLYGPYPPHGELARPEAAAGRQLPGEPGSPSAVEVKGLPPQALGSRYQMISDGKQVFLADLKEGRVWRYYHVAKEGATGKEDEGFLPLALYFGGKKYYSASETESPPAKSAEAPQPEVKPGEKKPR